MPRSAIRYVARNTFHQRRIVHRTRGERAGPIARLVKPPELGQVLKPFVALDLFDTAGSDFKRFGLHPHSGIATLTYLVAGGVLCEDIDGSTGRLAAGSVEWMKAGGGAWHGGGPDESGQARGFQLWLALPPSLELTEPDGRYLPAESIPQDGPVRVLLGEYGAARSVIPAPAPINYLAVRLRAGEHWRYQPPAGHWVCWVALSSGILSASETLTAGELAVFEQSKLPIDFEAKEDTEFLLGSAVPHPHDLVLGYYSVHTSTEALATAESHIAEARARLVQEGRLPAQA